MAHLGKIFLEIFVKKITHNMGSGGKVFHKDHYCSIIIKVKKLELPKCLIIGELRKTVWGGEAR